MLTIRSAVATSTACLRRDFLKAITFALLLACLSATMLAQSLAGLGAVSGVVHDPTGAIVSKAEVTITNASIGLTRTLLSSSDGVFEASSLPPTLGYVVTVKMAGFAPSTTKGITVHVGEIESVPVTLALSGVADTVSVVGDVVQIDTTDPGVSTSSRRSRSTTFPSTAVVPTSSFC